MGRHQSRGTINPADSAAIVVTGRSAALESAENRKKNAATIVDSVVADDAGKLPDNSITEVLQRVPGVTIVRFAAINPDHYSVEGSGIQIRGLSGVASRLNGREIFSANGGRSLLWGDVTPS
jgi:outer membrane receptor for ferrienterochelin and colicin